MLWADEVAPARGAPLEDLIPATVVALIGISLLAWVAISYLRGGAGWLRALAGFASRVGGLPTWAGLPALLAAVSLLCAMFGFYWDVSTHIDSGRDPGPFANPSHYFILAGLAGIALAGFLSLLLGRDAPRGPVFVGSAPLGGVLLTLCGVVALAGFPLDDVWHRLFGQDVTLWGPTHIQMVGGAALATLASWTLVREGRFYGSETSRRTDTPSKRPWFLRLREPTLAGAFLIGLSALQAEFDFGVPQFQLVYQPILLMLAAGMALVAARIRLGRGGAILSVAFFLLLRGALALIVGPMLGRTTPHFPLYLAEALVVEAVALRIPTTRRLTFALAGGAGIGTIGLAAEWGWSHIWMSNPWPLELLPEGATLGFAAAMAGAVVGGFIGGALDRDRPASENVRPTYALAGLVLVLFCLAYPAPTQPPREVAADVNLDFVEQDGSRAATVKIRPDPPGIAQNALWFDTMSWQGLDWERGSKRLVEFEEIAPGEYETVEAVPVGGQWKTMVRLHNEGYLVALPIYMPRDPAIPADEIPARERFRRAFFPDKELLQREAITTNSALQQAAYGVLAAIAIAWIAAFAWGLNRLEGEGEQKGRAPSRRSPVSVRAS
jgi:hypothetical protein